MNQQFLSGIPKSAGLSQAAETSLDIDIQLVVIDETRYYSDDMRKLAGKVFQVYAYDANRVTHCCEITPSYELHPVATQALDCPESDAEREKIGEMERSAPQDVIYMHCRAVEVMSDKYRRAHHVIERDLDESHDKQLESVLEHIRCNPPLVAPARAGCIII
ncbi:hypothetical protein [Pandoraea terrigena]|uniref:Uncharacterized protein n=1 Tax=Pandoraea terrigena TaxID=2508292 RepID=A0A5E4XGP9_9BURK|nr:hypothetical protein [Pandoraea terrigena]VVE35447.1 hypothetical protein PTE31013_03899 [Pandoraea terrigena]